MKILFFALAFSISTYGQSIKQDYLNAFNTSCNYKDYTNCKKIAQKSADFLSDAGMNLAIKNTYPKQYFYDRKNVTRDDWDNAVWPKSNDPRYIFYRMFIDGELTRIQTLDIFEINGVTLPKNEIKRSLSKELDRYFLDSTANNTSEVTQFRKAMHEQVVAILGSHYISLINAVVNAKEDDVVSTKKGKLGKRELQDFKEFIILRNQHIVQNIGMATAFNKAVDENITNEELLTVFANKYLSGLE